MLKPKSLILEVLLFVCFTTISGTPLKGQSWNTQVSEPGEPVEMIGLEVNKDGTFLVLLHRFYGRTQAENPDTVNIEVLEYSEDGKHLGRFEQPSLELLKPRKSVVSYKANSMRVWGDNVIVCGYTEEEKVREHCLLYREGELSELRLDSNYVYGHITNANENQIFIEAISTKRVKHNLELTSTLEINRAIPYRGFASLVGNDFIISVDGFPLLDRIASYKKENFKGDTLAIRTEINIGGNIMIDTDQNYIFYGFGVLKTDSMLNEIWRVPLDTLRIIRDHPGIQQETSLLIEVKDGGYILAGVVFDPAVPINFQNIFFTKLQRDGTIEWQRILPLSEAPLNSIAGIEESDGGLVILAKDEIGDKIWLVKLSSHGEFTTSTLDRSVKSKIKMYPNPTSNFLNISSSFMMDKIEIFDIYGRLIHSKNCDSSLFLSLDLELLVPGFYVIRVSDGSSNISETSRFLLVGS